MKLRRYTEVRAADACRLTNLLRVEPLTVAEFIAREARWPQQDLRLRWLGFEGQDAVALGQLAFSPYTPADHLAVQVAVASQHRGRGLGSAMLAHLERVAGQRGIQGLSATVPEADCDVQGWASRRGFRRHALRCDSLLDLERFDPACVGPVDLPISDMTGATQDQWRELASLLRVLIAQAPDMQGLLPWSEERCLSVLRQPPAARPEWVVVARAQGVPVGVSIGHAMGSAIYSFFTGVLPEWQGQGVGLALKQTLIKAAQSQGVGTMRTTNLDLNAPALRLNAALGFRRIPGSVDMRKNLLRPAPRFAAENPDGHPNVPT
jgi:GNAT superfamily N-acetyltransferase